MSTDEGWGRKEQNKTGWRSRDRRKIGLDEGIESSPVVGRTERRIGFDMEAPRRVD